MLAACSAPLVVPTPEPDQPSITLPNNATPVVMPTQISQLGSPSPVSVAVTALSSPIGPLIDEQTAIATARHIASIGNGHLGGASESPTEIQAIQLRLQAVPEYLLRQGWPEHSGDVGTIADTDVWVVTMKGTWQLNSPPVPAGTTPVPQPALHRYAIILNAKTGQEMGIIARP
jgi:hypothetical protein